MCAWFVKRGLSATLFCVVIGLAVAVLAVGGEAALSTQGFCTSCHSMTYPARSWPGPRTSVVWAPIRSARIVTFPRESRTFTSRSGPTWSTVRAICGAR